MAGFFRSPKTLRDSWLARVFLKRESTGKKVGKRSELRSPAWSSLRTRVLLSAIL